VFWETTEIRPLISSKSELGEDYWMDLEEAKASSRKNVVAPSDCKLGILLIARYDEVPYKIVKSSFD
jgi:hypothetical protein